MNKVNLSQVKPVVSIKINLSYPIIEQKACISCGSKLIETIVLKTVGWMKAFRCENPKSSGCTCSY